ncbi:glycine zipper 2TM domain-containing protein [Govanella unica]|uniref:Glycine zipper 2TM domain-containing protein n=1 Tax=Govanella unica TaxID=2975056 RepID=A0A9X3Z841_9PROT|nr:glycine zipper 2TM domain-containing protein [Govania unica]MDA5194644.1 glycine zipper 2TM domain-containing protein [Govania unica]
MIFTRPLSLLATAGLLGCLLATPAAAGNKGRNTIIGAGVGAAAGAVLSNGDPVATIGGAAVGGLIGNVATKDNRYDDRRHYSSRRAPPRHYHERRHSSRYDQRYDRHYDQRR